MKKIKIIFVIYIDKRCVFFCLFYDVLCLLLFR